MESGLRLEKVRADIEAIPGRFDDERIAVALPIISTASLHCTGTGRMMEAKGKTTTFSAGSISSVTPSEAKPICTSAQQSACEGFSMPALMNSKGKWRKQGSPSSRRRRGQGVNEDNEWMVKT